MFRLASSNNFKHLYVMLIVAVLCLFTQPAVAYLSDIKVLDKKEIMKLSDEGLSSTYLDVIIEIEANIVSHRTAGFTPKEFQQYKDLLRFEYELKSELQKRQLEVPTVFRSASQ